jgi:serine/threonine-protein kinase
MPQLPLVGTEFAGYRLRAVLGRGGMSIVYQAENPRLRNVIALKVLAPELASDQLFRARFREESQIAASLNHPHVIPIHDFGSSDGLLYIAMRYVSGTDLRHLIAERGWLTPDAAVYLTGQAARALDAAHHRGLVHRDVKPGNLLIAQGADEADPDHVYLADFGITKHVGGQSGLTIAGTVLGTVHYASPEQIQERPVIGMADQYALGCVLYECLTGRAPFEKSSNEAVMWAHVHDFPAPPSLLRPGLPPAIDEVFTRVLAKDPGDRYADCREFIAAARAALPAARTPPRGLRSLPTAAQPVGTQASGTQASGTRASGTRASGTQASGTRATGAQAWRTRATGAQAWGTRATGARASAAPDYSWMQAGFQPAPVPTDGLRGLDPVPAAQPPHQSASIPSDRTAGLGAAQWPAAPAAAPRGARARPRRRRPAGRSARGTLSLAAVAIVAVGGTAAGMLISQAATPSTVVRQLANSPAQPASALYSALGRTGEFTNQLQMSACTQKNAALVQCTDPDPAIKSVTFATYPSLSALYTKYQEIVDNLTKKSFGSVENMHVCGALAPNPTAENTWNHSDQYLTKYSVAQLASGNVPDNTAMGRVFCEQTPSGSEYIVWTQDYGRLLGYATGAASHEQVWNWFYTVHHNITFPGQPEEMTGMPMPPPATSSGPMPQLPGKDSVR